ncbi:TBC1 domain family member 23 [Intoshia linei]|uniref:TBC1 domain family member 23 n=1 Tax=Intoshia linei TaxID=1819745 RepID=A0A177AT88_9BILA|nr:TBC1 domain family member 23 [Intoshia linei]
MSFDSLENDENVSSLNDSTGIEDSNGTNDSFSDLNESIKNLIFSDDETKPKKPIKKDNDSINIESQLLIKPILLKEFLKLNKIKIADIVFDEIYNLTNQQILHNDVTSFSVDEKVAKINSNYSSDLEAIVTCYYKENSEAGKDGEYNKDDYICFIVFPLLFLNYSKSDIYNTTTSILNYYVPYQCNDSFNFLRFLLYFHDPQLASLFDTESKNVEPVFNSWMYTLFSIDSFPVELTHLWAFYFQNADQFMIFYLIIVLCINSRDEIIAGYHESKRVDEILRNLPKNINCNDVIDFISLAKYYISQTPYSFRVWYQDTIFQKHTDNSTLGIDEKSVSSDETCTNIREGDTINIYVPVKFYSPLCFTVSPSEVFDSLIYCDRMNYHKFFILDCRQANQFNFNGHLYNSYHIDVSLLIQSPKEFTTAIEAMLSLRSNAATDVILLVDEGNDPDPNTQMAMSDTNMLLSHLLKMNTKRVCLLDNGYRAYHQYVKNIVVDNNKKKFNSIRNHNVKMCQYCCKIESTNESKENEKSYFDLLVLKSTNIKNKVTDFIKENVDSYSTSSQDSSIFNKYESGQLHHPINVTDLIHSCNEINENVFFTCKLFVNNKVYNCYLLVTKMRLMVYRNLTTFSNKCILIASRYLVEIKSISAKKRDPNIITLRFYTIEYMKKQNVRFIQQMQQNLYLNYLNVGNTSQKKHDIDCNNIVDDKMQSNELENPSNLNSSLNSEAFDYVQNDNDVKSGWLNESLNVDNTKSNSINSKKTLLGTFSKFIENKVKNISFEEKSMQNTFTYDSFDLITTSTHRKRSEEKLFTWCFCINDAGDAVRHIKYNIIECNKLFKSKCDIKSDNSVVS